MDKLRNRLVSIVSFVIMGVALLATITIVIISFAGYSNYVYQEDVKSLDSYELNFNPDSYFIMINCKYDDVGIYYGTQPIKHFKQHIDWDSSTWSGKYENILETGVVLNDEICSYLNMMRFPNDTPVVIINVCV